MMEAALSGSGISKANISHINTHIQTTKPNCALTGRPVPVWLLQKLWWGSWNWLVLKPCVVSKWKLIIIASYCHRPSVHTQNSCRQWLAERRGQNNVMWCLRSCCYVTSRPITHKCGYILVWGLKHAFFTSNHQLGCVWRHNRSNVSHYCDFVVIVTSKYLNQHIHFSKKQAG